MNFDVHIDTSLTEIKTRQRPDLIIRIPENKKIQLIDVKFPFDNSKSFTSIRFANRIKYADMAAELSRPNNSEVITD